MGLKHSDLATTALTGNISNAALVIPITSAALFPTMAAGDYFYAALINTANVVEFVLVIGITGLNVTLAAGGRGLGGTTAVAWVTGDRFELHPMSNTLLALQQEAVKSTIAAGTDTYTATLVPAPQGYSTGQVYPVTFGNTNTLTNPNVNLNTFGAKTIVLDGAAPLVAGQLPKCALLQYDGTNMVLLNPNASASAASGLTTGDIKGTIKTAADAGWIMLNDGSIGDAASSATTRANADTAALFALLWNNFADAQCPVFTGRGASSAADFAAHKRITLPLVLGRAMGASGAGTGLTARALGLTTGVETYALLTGELAVHNHGITDPGHAHAERADDAVGSLSAPALNGATSTPTGIACSISTSTAATGISTQNNGSGTAHQNMQPTAFLNWMIKL